MILSNWKIKKYELWVRLIKTYKNDDENKNNQNTDSILKDLQVSSNNIDCKNQDIEKSQPVKFSRFKEDSNNNGFGYV